MVYPELGEPQWGDGTEQRPEPGVHGLTWLSYLPPMMGGEQGLPRESKERC